MSAATDLSIDRAPRWRGPLAAGAGIAVAAAVGLAGAAWWLRGDEAGALLALAAAAAALLAAAAAPAALLAGARARLAAARALPAAAAAGDPLLAVRGDGAGEALAALRRAASWPQALAAAPAAAAAALLPWLAPARAAAGSDRGELPLAVAAVAVAFPLLIAERRLLAVPADELPEARPLARLLRLAVWILVAGGCAAAARAHGLEQAAWVHAALAGLLGLLAGEALLRAAATPFMPVAHAGEVRGLGDGTLAALLATRAGQGAGAGAGLRERFGIDLSRSWALGFLRRAGPPLLAALVLLAWLASGLTALGTGERGVYERFGAPQAVLHPGLHLHLPWPLGRVVRTENGQLHELPLGDAGEAAPVLPRIAADADPGPEFDRLWERRHAAEGSWLVPSRDGGRQLVSADARVVWRIGGGDGDARDAAYAVAEPQALVRREAGRLFTAAFAAQPYDALVGEARDRLAAGIGAALRRSLAGTGIEVTAVVIDAIHPPTGAVPSYHAVQGAAIAAAADVAAARGRAARSVAEAQRDAAAARDAAAGAAAEAVAAARVDAARLEADAESVRRGGNAILIERRLQAIGRALARSRATVVDHRLAVVDGPLIDLRGAAAGTP